ncbi:hypothetical protein BH23BAC1_BH23BAC1_02800 [soil metagenome]
MESTYKPIDDTYFKKIEDVAKQNEFIRLQYYTEINEFLTTNQVAKIIIYKHGAYYLLLGNGEEVRLDRIVRVNDKPAPGYDESFFKCDL